MAQSVKKTVHNNYAILFYVLKDSFKMNSAWVDTVINNYY